MKIDYLQANLEDLENEMPVIRDIPWYEKALNGVGGTLVSLARDNIEGIAFIPYGIVDSVFGSNLNYNLSQKLDNAEEYLINNVVTDKQSYYYGKAVGNAICVAEGIVFMGVGLKVMAGGITLAAGGTFLTMTGAGAGLGVAAIAISGAAVAAGTGITAVGGGIMYSSANKFKENISEAKKVKVEVDNIKLKEDIKKLDDGISEHEKSISRIDEGVSKAEEIVGTKHNIINPTQDMVNREKVNYYIEKLKAGEKIDPIEVVDIEGKGKFIIEGHHRYVASKETGIPIEIKIKKGNGPTGMPDWSYVDWKKYISEEQFWGD